jgi:hypothetical protein
MVIGFMLLINTTGEHISTRRLLFSVTVLPASLGSIYEFKQWNFLCSQAHGLAGWRLSHTNILLC